MNKCPQCGRVYSNLVKTCPSCKIVLGNGSQELPKYGSNDVNNAYNTNPQPVKFCPHCGAPLAMDTKFCGNCGASVGIAHSEPEPQTYRPEIQYEQTDTQSEPQMHYQQPSQVNAHQDIGFWQDLKSFNFNGRLNRWLYFKFTAIVLCILFVLAFIVGLGCAAYGFNEEELNECIGLLLIAYIIITLPWNVRRLHDLNKNGLWILLTLIPGINFIMSIYMTFFKGTDGPNQYGRDPLQ